MTWRIVEISSNSKLEYKLNYMVIRNAEGIKKVFVPEISTLIVESTAVSMTSALLCELTKRKVRIILCDEKRNPYSEIAPYYGSHDTVRKLRNQIRWPDELAEKVWALIIKDKINKQRGVLVRRGYLQQADLLSRYMEEIEPYDASNREGHAAKVYFNAIFGKDFVRGFPDNINSALNYGYAILLSAFNREISISGYYTELGIFHDNLYNEFNLSCDLIEPFRPLIDELVLDMELEIFETDQKHKLVDVLNSTVTINGKQNYLNNAIRLYVQSFFDVMESGDLEKMVTYEVEIHESAGVFRSSN